MANALVIGASGKYVGQDLVGEAAGAPPAPAGSDPLEDYAKHPKATKWISLSVAPASLLDAVVVPAVDDGGWMQMTQFPPYLRTLVAGY